MEVLSVEEIRKLIENNVIKEHKENPDIFIFNLDDLKKWIGIDFNQILIKLHTNELNSLPPLTDKIFKAIETSPKFEEINHITINDKLKFLNKFQLSYKEQIKIYEESLKEGEISKEN